MAGQGANQKRGSDSHKWKGGILDNGEYLLQYLPQEHWLYPYGKKGGGSSSPSNRYMLQHRVVMAEYLERPLKPWETVHHINGNTRDNNIENLQLRIGKHGNGQVIYCIDCESDRLGYKEIK